MKKVTISILIMALFFVSHITKAQNDTKSYDFKDFNKVQIENINGVIEIELGKLYSVTVSGNYNAQEQVQISKSKDKLLVTLNSTFVTDWKKRKVVTVEIVMPDISNLYNFSNADVTIQKFTGSYLNIENKGNGNVSVTGSVVSFIDIKNNGNGNIETKNIVSKKVGISKSGNGDVSIKTDNNFNVTMSGNGDIVNFGKGKAILDKQAGTGKVVYRN